MDREKVVVAEIVRTRGLRGEVVARSQTDVPDRFKHLGLLNAQLANGQTVSVQLSDAWEHKGDWVLKFAGIESIEAAEPFRGADLWVPYTERAELADGAFYQSDLIGCQVISTATGESLGVVEGWQQHGGATPLMEVRSAEREQLIPFVTSWCQIDLNARTIRMDLPEGLLEL